MANNIILHRGDSPRALRFIGKSFESCFLSWIRAPPGHSILILNIFPKNLNARGESPRCNLGNIHKFLDNNTRIHNTD